MTAMETVKASRWQLLVASVLLAVWIVFLAIMSFQG
jgi:hypothetical protein